MDFNISKIGDQLEAIGLTQVEYEDGECIYDGPFNQPSEATVENGEFEKEYHDVRKKFKSTLVELKLWDPDFNLEQYTDRSRCISLYVGERWDNIVAITTEAEKLISQHSQYCFLCNADHKKPPNRRVYLVIGVSSALSCYTIY